MPDNSFAVTSQAFRHGTYDLIFFKHRSFFLPPFERLFPNDLIDNPICGNLAFEQHVIVKDEERRTADQDNGNDVFVEKFYPQIHVEREPPHDVHRRIEPNRFDGERNPAVDFEFQLQSVY